MKQLIWIALLLPIAATAAEFQSIDSIRARVNAFLMDNYAHEQNIEFEIGHFDRRLRLEKCDRPLEIFKPVGARQHGYTTVGVRCHGSRMWKIHVPVKIKRFAEVLVSKRTLPRGSVVRASDLNKIRYDVTRLNNGFFTKADEVNGMVLKRSLRQGAVLTATALEIPKLIKRGESITIVATTGNLSIRVKGKALMDGRQGDVIRVMNANSKRELQAVVISTGLVKVTM